MRDLESGVRTIRIPHPERVLYPEAGITRADVVSYYAEVAPYLLREAKGRALTVKRWPHGINGPMFYQKHPRPGEPIRVEDTATLITWVGQGALEWHAPLGHEDDPLSHDWAILDLDPNPPAGWNQVVQVARIFKALLDLMEVPFLLKSSGQRGLHFYIGIQPLNHALVMDIVGRWAKMVVDTAPNLATVERLKRHRGARVYLDYLQNGHARTTVMAYSLRATPRATVSLPIGWEEVTHPPEYWTLSRALARLRERGDLFRWSGPRLDLEGLAGRHGIHPPSKEVP